MSGEIRGDSEGVASGPTTKPSNFVARVIDDRAELEPALEELLAARVARESVAILQGERGADAISRRGARGLKTWLRRTGEILGDERQYVDRYEEEARRGHFVLGVPLSDASDATRERIRGILIAHGAHSVVSSTPWTHTGEEPTASKD